MDKLKSRKFIMACVAALFVILNKGLGLDLPEDTITQFVAVIVSYLIGQGAVDVASVLKNGK